MKTIHTDIGMDYILHCKNIEKKGGVIPWGKHYLEDNYQTSKMLMGMYGYHIVYLTVPYHMY